MSEKQSGERTGVGKSKNVVKIQVQVLTVGIREHE